MTVTEVKIIEDTLTPWITRKIEDLPSFEQQLIETLHRALVKDIKPYVPRERGYLEESAETVWFIEPALHNWRMEIVWTGMLNPHRDGIHKDFIGDDGERLDYALFQYYAPLRHDSKPQATHLWFEYGVKDFEANNYGGLDKLYLEWLFKK